MIFIDTGAFLARYLEKDQFHQQARDCWAELESGQRRLVTSNFVLDETATLLGRRAGNLFAAHRLQNIYASRALQIWRPTQEDEMNALNWFIRFADQRISFTDCISFVLMIKVRVQSVFSFDRHFDSAGFARVSAVYS